MEKKSAVYICTGCGIGDALDIDKLTQIATDEFSAPICRKHEYLCSREGAELIKSPENEHILGKIVHDPGLIQKLPDP